MLDFCNSKSPPRFSFSVKVQHPLTSLARACKRTGQRQGWKREKRPAGRRRPVRESSILQKKKKAKSRSHRFSTPLEIHLSP